VNAPRLYFPDLPALRWSGDRCTSTTAEICAAMAWLRTTGGAIQSPHGGAAQLRTRLWLEVQRRLTGEGE
jgi:hypothetical protein